MDWKRLYAGFLQTPLLWGKSLNGLIQFETPDFPTPPLSREGSSNMRLGSLAEHFTFDYWRQAPGIKLLANNVQINGENETLGEIDAIIQQGASFTHLEIAYKIYLFDPSHGNTILDHWIGPNRKDSLVEKLHRMQQHQLPLIDAAVTRRELGDVVPLDTPIVSKVFVKGLLFLPEGSNQDISPLNADCIAGIYLHREQLSQYGAARFYLPSKSAWMMLPHAAVDWKSSSEFEEEISPLLDSQYAPMIWMKRPNGVISRLFVVWW